MRKTLFVLAVLGLLAAAAFGIAYAVRPYRDIQRAGLGLLSVASFGGAAVCAAAGALVRRR